MAEYRVFGPPGTGKTSFLAQQIGRALWKYDPFDVVACSFTRAAAVEIGGRDTGLPRENVGTIHSLCYHSLGSPTIAEVTPELRDDWNERYPGWAIGSSVSALDETPSNTGPLQAWNVARSRLRPESFSDGMFVQAWEAFKAETESIDFTDMLLRAPDSIDAKVLFLDEAQDLTPLQWRIVRQWGAQAETFVVAGDDDQLLYQFLGADVDAFLSPLPDEQKRFLGQSYRLPRAVLAVADAWIKRLDDVGGRQAKDYKPRDADGECHEEDYRLAEPTPLVSRLQEHAHVGESCMVLASCAYMLQDLIDALKEAGIPYHNPYRQKRGDWNPLRTVGRRILDFLECARQTDRGFPPPAEVWWPWVEMLKAGDTLTRGAKTWYLRRHNEGGQVSVDDLTATLTPDLIDAMVREDVPWLAAHATKRFAEALTYPADVYAAHGADGLRNEPAVVVGTIHSVKGGQADNVYLFPDLSYQAAMALDQQPVRARAALIRQVYVGMTRARERLALCQPSGKLYWRWCT